jgi:hypothetical protein
MEVVNKHTKKEPQILHWSDVVAECARERGCNARVSTDEDKERYVPPMKTKKVAIEPANGCVPLLNKVV